MKNYETQIPSPPKILAPAGNKNAFLAALAAGADEIYCGLRYFSARMAAENFTIEELVPLTMLARDKGVKVHVALNALLKPDELNTAGRLLRQLDSQVKPDGIIVQDLAFVPLAGQTGFRAKFIFRPCLTSVFQQPFNRFKTALEFIGSCFPGS